MRIHHVLLPLFAVTAAITAPSAGAFTLLFDYSHDTGFFGVGTDARNRLEDAGAFFEGLIGDDLNAITPSGGDSWMTSYSDPATGGPGFQFNPSIPADTLVVYVGARDLGGSTLGEAGPGGWSGGGSPAWQENIRQRGEAGSTQSPGATDFAPWGGSLAMDSDTNWDYSLDGSTLDPTESHFYSVLIHEIGHILGYGTAASWTDQINGSNEFTGSASVASFGGDIPLQTGGGHWLNGTTSTVYGGSTSQEAAMDPSITIGTRKEFTDLDVAGLQDIGWEIIPEPGSGALALLGLMLFATRRARSQP